MSASKGGRLYFLSGNLGGDDIVVLLMMMMMTWESALLKRDQPLLQCALDQDGLTILAVSNSLARQQARNALEAGWIMDNKVSAHIHHICKVIRIASTSQHPMSSSTPAF